MTTEPCTCSPGKVQALICEFLDSGTTPERAAEIRAVFADCPECLERLRSEREVRVIMRRCCETTTAPGYLRERITTQINITRGG